MTDIQDIWEDTPEEKAYKDALARRRQKAWPEFFELLKNNKAFDIDFWEGGSGDPTLEPEHDRVPQRLGISNSVSSKTVGPNSVHGGELHIPVLDLDYNALLLESSTPGHHHLFIDCPMPWDDYVKLLTVMGEVGLLEPGYVSASINRGASYTRTPWTKKGE